MDPPVLCLLFLLPEKKSLMGYLSWTLWNSGLCLRPDIFFTEPESATIKAPKSTHDAQSIPDPGADLCLVDLWSMDPVLSQVPNLNFSPSTLVQSGDLDVIFFLQCSHQTAWSHPLS